MAEAATYEIEWANKPLGFSIVMDTTGNNAYVSSIQKEENKRKGLKLAAQIIKINGKDVKGMEHKQILQHIKQAPLPIKLVFQPRSFANDPQQDQIPTPIHFKGAKVNQNRINGCFELIKEKFNGKHQWQRKDEETDPIILWHWPSNQADNATGKNLWMIGRKSNRNKEGAYACCDSNLELPTDIEKEWQCYDPSAGDFVKSVIQIAQEKQ